jgi:hypothetical protein
MLATIEPRTAAIRFDKGVLINSKRPNNMIETTATIIMLRILEKNMLMNFN